MPVTLATARQALRENLGEQFGRAWDDLTLDRYLYEGCKDVARQTEYLESSAAIDVSSGDNQIPLPTDLIRVYLSEWQNDADSTVYQLQYADFNISRAVNWINTDATGYPSMVSYYGAVPKAAAILYPSPAIAGTLTVYYYRLPIDPRAQYTVPDLDDEDEDNDLAAHIDPDTVTLELPEGWEDAVYLYAEMTSLRRDRDPRWQEAKTLYEAALGRLFDLTRRHTDQNGQYIGRATASANSWLYEMGDY